MLAAETSSPCGLARQSGCDVQLPKQLQEFLAGLGESLRVFKSGVASQAYVAQCLLARGKNVVVVVPGAKEHRELAALLGLLSPPLRTPLAPAWERPWVSLPPYIPRPPAPEDWAVRFAALESMLFGPRPRGALVAADNLLPWWPPLDVFSTCRLTLARGEEMSPELIAEQAAGFGYRGRKFVSAVGELARRGDILDVFAPGYELPLRFEFFGDRIEEIRLFDPASQRSQAELAEAQILPVAPAVLSGAYPGAAAGHWARLRTAGEFSAREEEELRARLEGHDGSIWPGLFYPGKVGLEAFFPRDAVFVLPQAEGLRACLADQHKAWREALARTAREQGLRWPQHAVCRTEEGARRAGLGARRVVFEDLTLGTGQDGLALPERGIGRFSDLFWKPEDARRPWSALVRALGEWGRTRQQTVLSFRSERSRKKFLSLLEPEALPFSFEYSPFRQGLFALVSPLRTGMELAWSQSLILSEDVLQPAPARDEPDRAKGFVGLAAHDELDDGDLLVHSDYGLSRFGGLTRLKAGEAVGDFLLLFFAGDDRLYLPVDRLNLVQRFKGPEGANPALDQLGGSLWKRTTARARKAIEKIARELVEMYAFRKVAKGFRYGSLSDLYHEFETTFGFEETPDQARAVEEVFADMDAPSPMDRLVCGDVGFGKTEVALRAAFRTVLEGRQAVLLCPTTVLAEQHHQTFSQRLAGFPVRVGMLSRFVSAKDQKAVVAAAARGEIDILIGTHRLLSKDVSFPRLGLLILDEEQRFGVAHKERLKHLRRNIDVLALTATPIPRTLQLSLSGIRGLSVIETPPVDRKPVETALVERDAGMLKAVLDRELARGGQVFWVHNRVQALERVLEFVRRLAPQARVGLAHGQLPERELESAMHRFWKGETDILVTTAIIESGLDFPNANTLVVDQAQMFGLGQLYKLRGRVGRSERQAFAYFVVPELAALPETAKRRLRIILDMDYLGAGFRVALEDLRMRGAGNILGEVQSGQITRVGLDLYLEMLEEEVRRLKGEALVEVTDPEMQFVFEAHIPEDYVAEPRERLRYYKMLSSAASEASLVELAAELKDRFGTLPEALGNFLAVLDLKRTLSRLQVLRAELYPGRGVFAFGEETSAVDPKRIVDFVAGRSGFVRLLPPGRLEVRCPEGAGIREGLSFLRSELEELLPTAAK